MPRPVLSGLAGRLNTSRTPSCNATGAPSLPVRDAGISTSSTTQKRHCVPIVPCRGRPVRRGRFAAVRRWQLSQRHALRPRHQTNTRTAGFQSPAIARICTAPPCQYRHLSKSQGRYGVREPLQVTQIFKVCIGFKSEIRRSCRCRFAERISISGLEIAVQRAGDTVVARR